jgi:hypothetical protein
LPGSQSEASKRSPIFAPLQDFYVLRDRSALPATKLGEAYLGR